MLINVLYLRITKLTYKVKSSTNLLLSQPSCTYVLWSITSK